MSDPKIRTGQPLPGWLYSAVSVVFSAVVTLVVCSLTPPGWRGGLPAAALVVTIVLATGRGERVAVAVMAGARELRPHELAGVAPALKILREAQILPEQLELLAARSDQDRLMLSEGRGTLVVSAPFLTAASDGAIPASRVATQLALGITALRLGQRRYSVAIAFATTPWRMARYCIQAASTLGPLVAPVKLAWMIRFLFIPIVIPNSASHGDIRSGIAAATLLVLTYLVPWLGRRADQVEQDRVDAAMLAAGWGPALADLITTRGVRTDRDRARLHRLQSASPTQDSGLRLVS